MRTPPETSLDHPEPGPPTSLVPSGVGLPRASRRQLLRMSSCANIFTPRGTTQLWPAINLPKGGRLTLKQCTFNPIRCTPKDYQAPPPPPPLRRPPKKRNSALDIKSGDLVDKAADLRRQADRLEKSTPPLSLTLQFGTLVLDQGIDSFAKRYLKEWDQRGRGEVAPLPLTSIAVDQMPRRSVVS